MNLSEAQHDMRQAYLGGAPGLLASGTAWLVAGVLALTQAPGTAVLALLIGGMFIHPAAVLICKAAGRSGRHQAGNPLGRLALESTVQLLLAIVVAFALSRLRAEWFFPSTRQLPHHPLRERDLHAHLVEELEQRQVDL
jgi:hypothetical protein